MLVRAARKSSPIGAVRIRRAGVRIPGQAGAVVCPFDPPAPQSFVSPRKAESTVEERSGVGPVLTGWLHVDSIGSEKLMTPLRTCGS